MARKTRLELAGPLRVGLVANAQGYFPNSERILDEADRTRTRWLRESFEWGEIEPEDDAWAWRRYDELLIAAAQRGIRILPLLIGSPPWAGLEWNEIPADPTEYAEYTAQVVARYGPGGSFWEAHPEIAAFAPQHFE
ncbi:MAG: hypothetical protein ACRDMA_02140, partial [Solirubrobacterales bacterium]